MLCCNELLPLNVDLVFYEEEEITLPVRFWGCTSFFSSFYFW